ncbi:recombinase RecA, partial [Streptomyces sp. NPDC055897]
RNFLKDNPDLANEIERKILEKLGIGVPAKPAAAEDPGAAPVPAAARASAGNPA